jgi:hypothetical protein
MSLKWNIETRKFKSLKYKIQNKLSYKFKKFRGLCNIRGNAFDFKAWLFSTVIVA